MSSLLQTRHIVIPCTDSTPSTEVPVVTLFDRRTPSWDNIEWLFQSDLERLLFSNQESTGAFYRLLNRCQGYNTPALRGSLSLRRASVARHLVTDDEWRDLVTLTHSGVRVITLVPLDTAVCAVRERGEFPMSSALLTALGATLPPEWEGATPVAPSEARIESSEDENETEERGRKSEEEGSGEESSEEESEEEGSGEESSEEESGKEGDAEGEDDEDEESAGEGGSAEGEDDEDEESGGEGGGEEDGGGDDDFLPPTEPEDNEDESSDEASDVSADKCTTTNVLEGELDAFTRWRQAPLNVHRLGTACVAMTAGSDRARIVQFLGWLERRGAVIGVGAVFSSTSIARTVQEYVNECRTRELKWSTLAKRIGSLLHATRFVHSAMLAKNTPVPTAAADQLAALHSQSLRSAAQEAKFSAGVPENWLDWTGCLRARQKAERALAHFAGRNKRKKYTLVKDVALLVLLTEMPPDRLPPPLLAYSPPSLSLCVPCEPIASLGKQPVFPQGGRNETFATSRESCP